MKNEILKTQNSKILVPVIVSLMIHSVFLVGVAWWSLRSVIDLGGGGTVEVALVGDGSNSVSLRGTLATKQSRGIASSLDGLGDRSDKAGAEEGGAEGGGGATGGGIGTGAGPGDPRLAAIWRKINRSKYYPEFARRQGLEGAPKVAFSISENGKVEGVKVVESSGNEVLDKAALETIERSSPLPFYPKPITIAVRYSLKDH